MLIVNEYRVAKSNFSHYIQYFQYLQYFQFCEAGAAVWGYSGSQL